MAQSVDARLQKKGYKVLERVLTCEAETQKAFVRQQLQGLVTVLTDSLSTSSSSSKKVCSEREGGSEGILSCLPSRGCAVC